MPLSPFLPHRFILSFFAIPHKPAITNAQGFTARIPDVPAYGEGETEEAAIADLKEAIRGYTGEIQDFMECATLGREPLAGVDLAYEAIQVHYAGYWAAEEGRRISL